jgi:hypothetical protein
MVMWARRTANRVRTRGEWLARIEKAVRKDSPRLLMTAIVAATGAAGVLGSVLLHRGGMFSMWLRYGLSVVFAYVSFMFFIWLWIVLKRRRQFADPGDWRDAEDDLDDLEVASELVSNGPAGAPSVDPPMARGYGAHTDSGVAGDVAGGLDLDDGIVAVAVVAALAAAVAASLYVVIVAPQFVAELLLDGVFAAGLYRRLRAVDRRHWLDSALSRTWLPALLVAAFFMIAGAVCQWYAPEASSLGGVWRHWRAK